MTSTRASQRAVFQQLSRKPYCEWPAYDSTPLYVRSSLRALEEDIQYVATVWFQHNAHNSFDDFICRLLLFYFEFTPQDHYAPTTQYEMKQLFRVFLLKDIHGWTHETALVKYLQQSLEISEQLGIDSVPDQSTLWST